MSVKLGSFLVASVEDGDRRLLLNEKRLDGELLVVVVLFLGTGDARKERKGSAMVNCSLTQNTGVKDSLMVSRILVKG